MIRSPSVRVKVPSKTFLLGEYAVLHKKNSLIVNHGPLFCFDFYQKPGAVIDFHPQSLAGKLTKNNSNILEDYFVHVSDPYRGLGGLGLSSAEFVATWMLLEYLDHGDGSVVITDLIAAFLEVIFVLEDPPSGADIIAQCQDNVLSIIGVDPFAVKAINWPFKAVDVVLFHTLQHCKTSDHVKKDLFVPTELLVASEHGIAAVEADDLSAFVENVKRFVNVQDQAGLLSKNTKQHLDKLNKLKGVHVSKGCGALGCDVIAVFCDVLVRDVVLQFGSSLGLVPLYCDINRKHGLGSKRVCYDDQEKVGGQ